MIWKKLKQIFCPDNNYPWMVSHASYPWAEQVENELFNIYFSCRDTKNKSSIGHIAFNMDTLEVTGVPDVPVLLPGETGAFDDSGVSMSCMININGKKHLYYLGWNLMVTVPWRNCIGLAISSGKDEVSFLRYSKAPVLGIHDVDPFTLTYPFVMLDGGQYKMWYGSSLYWGPKVQDTRHVIKYATSADGINWNRLNHICIDTNGKAEFALVKPFVLKEDGMYKMWYCYRDESYHMGYAESADGLNWERQDDKVGIEISESGWDSGMVCYPYIFDYKGRRYMLYNGNEYGKTGFGLAVLEC
ncbi:MAG: hypothetical protein ABIQ31_12715 [Ferruginibacter sp.]